MEILNYLIAGLLGVLIHCLIKANSLIKEAVTANLQFTIKDYLSKDWLGISLSVVMVFVWYLIFGEVGNKYPKILDYIISSFVGMGLLGSYLIQTVFSRGKKYIRNVIDYKTNIADSSEVQSIIGDRPDDRK